MKNKELVKQANSIKHICDKIYVNKKMDKILGVYPYSNKKYKSIYRIALKKCLKDSFYRVLIWGIVDIITFFIFYSIINTSLAVGLTVVILCIIFNIISLISNIICFQGRFLDNITVSCDQIINAINQYCENISISDNDSINAQNYKRLDILSQIVDTAEIRAKKIQILLSMKNEFEYDWKYESDTILITRHATNGSIQRVYLNKIRAIDEDLLGPASRTTIN